MKTAQERVLETEHTLAMAILLLGDLLREGEEEHAARMKAEEEAMYIKERAARLEEEMVVYRDRIAVLTGKMDHLQTDLYNEVRDRGKCIEAIKKRETQSELEQAYAAYWMAKAEAAEKAAEEANALADACQADYYIVKEERDIARKEAKNLWGAMTGTPRTVYGKPEDLEEDLGA